ncbi:TetR family transcriptional regulator [Actinoplanes sp. NPDC049681]|uniref:TetR/AcrR family transcriptional regulator n=1 Tax=Actinoplanes sp. NPDC049681 TaxID=3363905 RepID=UPI00378C4E6E
MDPGTVWDQPMQPTRRMLIDAAQQEILERGYHGTSLRGVARRSGVDPSLVRHYFGSKDELLMQAVQGHIDPVEFAKEILRGAPGAVGSRIVRFMLGFWEDPASTKSLVRLVSTLNSPQIADLMKDAFIVPFFGAIAAEVSPDRPELRAALAASQMMTLGLSRYVLGAPTLSRMERQELVRIVGRSLQRCLTGPLPEAKDGRSGAVAAARTGENHG